MSEDDPTQQPALPQADSPSAALPSLPPAQDLSTGSSTPHPPRRVTLGLQAARDRLAREAVAPEKTPTKTRRHSSGPERRAYDATRLPGAKRPRGWWAPPDGERYQKAVRIRDMRALGMSYTDIAAELGITPGYCASVMYIAGRNRWFKNHDWASTKDRIDNDIIPRALDQLSTLIDHDDPNIRLEATMETLKGTAFKKYDQQGAVSSAPVIVGLKIEMPPGPPQQMREGVIEAAPAYTDDKES